MGDARLYTPWLSVVLPLRQDNCSFYISNYMIPLQFNSPGNNISHLKPGVVKYHVPKILALQRQVHSFPVTYPKFHSAVLEVLAFHVRVYMDCFVRMPVLSKPPETVVVSLIIAFMNPSPNSHKRPM